MIRLVRKSVRICTATANSPPEEEVIKSLVGRGLPCAGEEDGGRWRMAADECGHICMSNAK